jgi:hypothetical protein
MVYFRELPVPLKELDPGFVEIFFDFANTYTEKSVLEWYIKQRKTTPDADKFRRLGYTEEDIANMEL